MKLLICKLHVPAILLPKRMSWSDHCEEQKIIAPVEYQTLAVQPIVSNSNDCIIFTYPRILNVDKIQDVFFTDLYGLKIQNVECSHN